MIPIVLFVFAAGCSNDSEQDTADAKTESANSPQSLTPDPTRATRPARSPSATVHVRPGLQPALVTRVVDGDTIDVEIDGVEYDLRYIGIDTPETVDPRRPVECFGAEASGYNRHLVEGRVVGLEKDVSETDDFGRLLRYVWVGDTMVNAALVRDGYAHAVTYQPDVKYQEMFLDLQQEAREAGRGLWGDTCRETGTPATRTATSGTCEYSDTGERVIKGNISQSTGERIYHVPGQQYYAATVINEGAGERWFCTEAEAQGAGWRKAKV